MLRKITVITLSFCLIAFLSACAAESSKTETAQSQSEDAPNSNGLPLFLKTDIPESSAISAADTAAALTTVDEKSLLVGTWRHNWGQTAPNCLSEHIFMADGSYSGMGGCPGYVPLRTVGKWYVTAPGTIRLQYSDYEPKRDQAGNLLRIPGGETWTFKFVDRNRFVMGGGIVAYRVN